MNSLILKSAKSIKLNRVNALVLNRTFAETADQKLKPKDVFFNITQGKRIKFVELYRYNPDVDKKAHYQKFAIDLNEYLY